MSERLKALFVEYGKLAVTIYFVIFAVVLAGFAIAISAGYSPAGAARSAGVLGAAWVATKLTQPLRILATLLLTPLVGRFVLRRRPVAISAPAPEIRDAPGGD